MVQKARGKRAKSRGIPAKVWGLLVRVSAGLGVLGVVLLTQYSVTLQSPERLRIRTPKPALPQRGTFRR
jgi:hypothetical protein